MTNETIFAHTESGGSLPGYINIRRGAGGQHIVSVRGRGQQHPNELVVSPELLECLAAAVMAAITSEVTPPAQPIQAPAVGAAAVEIEFPEPIVEIGPDYSLRYVGAEPIATLLARHPGTRVGTFMVAVSEAQAYAQGQFHAGWRIASAKVQAPEAPHGAVSDDTKRIDWLATQFVTVRTPLRYGSAENFMGSPDDNDGESVPWDIRAKIDAAMVFDVPVHRSGS